MFTLAIEHWPAQHQLLLQGAAAAELQRLQAADQHAGGQGMEGGGASQALQATDMPTRMILWLEEFNMDQRLLEQLLQVVARIPKILGRQLSVGAR
jgi:hypothetical protein